MAFNWASPWRSERYEFELLDPNLKPLGLFSRVESAKLSWAKDATIRGSGSITAVTSTPVPWQSRGIRVWLEVSDGTETQRHCIFTGLCRAPEETWAGGEVTADVELQDPTLRLVERIPTSTHTVPQGTNLIEAVRQIMVAEGVPLISLAPSAAVAARTMSWDPASDQGLNWLRVCNDLCEAAGYYGIFANWFGALVAAPYLAPTQRSVSYTFDDGAGLRYLGRLKGSNDARRVANEWVAWSTGGTDNPPFFASASNTDPNHPFHAARQGRTITERLSDIDAADQAALQTRVNRVRDDRMAEARSWTLDVLWVPVLEHDRVAIGYERDTLRFDAVVAKRSLTCSPGSLLQLEVRQM